MIFRKSKKTVKKSMGKMDKLVTGIIIGGAAASIFGASRTKTGKKFSQKILIAGQNIIKKSLSTFGDVTVKFLSWFQKK